MTFSYDRESQSSAITFKSYLQFWEQMGKCFDKDRSGFKLGSCKSEQSWVQLIPSKSAAHYQFDLRKRTGVIRVSLDFESSNTVDNQRHCNAIFAKHDYLSEQVGNEVIVIKPHSEDWRRLAVDLQYSENGPTHDDITEACDVMHKLIGATIEYVGIEIGLAPEVE